MVGPLLRANVRYYAKFCASRSNRCGDLAIFRFFKMAAVHHLGFVVRLLGPRTKRSWWSLLLYKIWSESAL